MCKEKNMYSCSVFIHYDEIQDGLLMLIKNAICSHNVNFIETIQYKPVDVMYNNST